MDHDERREAIRQALRRLATKGPGAIWSPSLRPLMNLQAVRDQLAEDPEADAATVVASVLEDAINRLDDDTYQDLLRIVLRLDDQTRERPLMDRRAAAAHRFALDGRDISPNTVRQYHEPRAMDQLAAVLASNVPTVQGPTPRATTGAVLRWHPAVHEATADERLILIRLTFRSYQRSTVLERLRLALETAGVQSWSVHELLGGVDLLIQAWVAPGSWATIPRELQAALSPTYMLMLDVFQVTALVSDWRWPITPAQVDISDLSHRMRSGTGVDVSSEELIRSFEARGLAARTVAASGIRFLVTVRNDEHFGAEQSVLEAFRRAIDACLRRHGVIVARVLEGLGFATFVIDATIDPSAFSTIRDFQEDLAQQTAWGGFRLSTWVFASDQPVEEWERLPEVRKEGAQPSVVEALEEGESALVEVKTGVTRRRGAEDTRPHKPDWRPIVRVIAAMLNGEGGTVVVGATEDARSLGETEDHYPRVGPWVICGIDEQMQKGWNHYEHELLAAIAHYIEPSPSPFIAIEREQIESRTICVIRVAEGSPRWYWLKDGRSASTFLVREGARTLELSGAAADGYRVDVRRRWEGNSAGASAERRSLSK